MTQSACSPEEIRERILRFVSRCAGARPVLKEEATEPVALEAGRFTLEVQGNKLLLEAWDESRSVVRRIVGVRRESESEMVLAYRRFGQGQGTLRILASAKSTGGLRRDALRAEFAERLRKLLLQGYPGWKVDALSAERDLARSFSVRVVRAHLWRGQEAWAVAGCGEQEGEAATDSLLAQGLAWLDHLRKPPGRHGPQHRVVAGLKLFLPEAFAATTAWRLRFLNPSLARFELYLFNDRDEVRPAAEADFGNLATAIPSALQAMPVPFPALQALKQLAERTGAELRPRANFGLACAIHGLAFARAAQDGAWFGFGDDWQPLTPESLEEAARLAAEIARLRRPDSPDRQHPFYTAQAERWLESLLLSDISLLDSGLDPRHAYSQVPAIAGRQRGIIDLLAVTRQGRLVVIELKASPDLDLPLQALDYWMRVKWHLDRGEFRRLGYFPGIELAPDPPLLWLAIPAFDFHPLNETVIHYLSPEVPVRWIGLNHQWREGVKVVTR